MCAAALGVYPSVPKLNVGVSCAGVEKVLGYSAWSAMWAGDSGRRSVFAICGYDAVCMYGEAGPADAIVEADGVR